MCFFIILDVIDKTKHGVFCNLKHQFRKQPCCCFTFTDEYSPIMWPKYISYYLVGKYVMKTVR